MNKINIDQVQDGAVLAADISADSGHILLRAGTVLSGRHVGLLKSRGVSDVHVSGSSSSTNPESKLAPDAIDSIVKRRFRKVDTHQALISQLVVLCRARLQ